MTLALFVLGLLAGAAVSALLLVPRLRSAIRSARVATEAERAARRDAEHAAGLARERQSAHDLPGAEPADCAERSSELRGLLTLI